MKNPLKIIAIIVGIGAVYVGVYASRFRVIENFHEVDPGRLYRSAQLTESELDEKIARYGIKTVISLRGDSADNYWLKPEIELARRRGLEWKGYALDVDRYPTKDQLDGILADFDNAPKPILIHCRSGADRTGMIAALYVFDIMHKPKSEAMQQLDIKFGHLAYFHPAMDNFVKEYTGREWAKNYRTCPDKIRIAGQACADQVLR